MPHTIEETAADRAAWARLWTLTRSPWERTEDLAHVLGVARSAVAQWATGDRQGPWAALRAALRETARRRPTSVARLVEGLASELLDAHGRWIPEGQAVGDYRDESDDVVDALAGLTRLIRSGAPKSEVTAAARRLVREAEECASAAEAK